VTGNVCKVTENEKPYFVNQNMYFCWKMDVIAMFVLQITCSHSV